MGLSATFYAVSALTFQTLTADPSSFHPKQAEQWITFDQNQEGVEHVLDKCMANPSLKAHLLFSPEALLQPKPEAGASIEEHYLEAVPYHPPERVTLWEEVLQNVSNECMVSAYDPEDMNQNGVYPETWHNDESPHLAFNRSHVVTAIEQLKVFIAEAHAEEHYILVFVG